MSDNPPIRHRSRAVMITVVVLVTAVVVALVLLLTRQPAPPVQHDAAQPSTSATEEPAPNDPQQPVSDQQKELISAQWRHDPNDVLAEGPVDAALTVAVYLDPQCGYCAQFAQEVEPQLREMAQAGELRVEYTPLAILGDGSVLGSQALHAAAQAGHFHEFQDYIYQHLTDGTPVAMTEDGLIEAAQAAGIDDVDTFRATMTAPETAERVRADQTNALNIGITGTPAFFIGHRYVAGFIDWDEMESLIHSELEQQE